MATIFTKIIQGEIPSYRIHEDDLHYAFLDINPASEGHTLVIPKEEVDYLFDLEPQRLQELMGFAHSIARAIDRALQPVRTAVVVDGREVPHAHVHLIPIQRPDQKIQLGKQVDPDEQRMDELARMIRKELGQ